MERVYGKGSINSGCWTVVDSVVAPVRSSRWKAFVAALTSGERFSAACIFRSSSRRTSVLLSGNVDSSLFRDELRILLGQVFSSKIKPFIWNSRGISNLLSSTFFLTLSKFSHSKCFHNALLIKSRARHWSWSSSSRISIGRHFLWGIISGKTCDSPDLHWMDIFFCHWSSEAEPVRFHVSVALKKISWKLLFVKFRGFVSSSRFSKLSAWVIFSVSKCLGLRL